MVATALCAATVRPLISTISSTGSSISSRSSLSSNESAKSNVNQKQFDKITANDSNKNEIISTEIDDINDVTVDDNDDEKMNLITIQETDEFNSKYKNKLSKVNSINDLLLREEQIDKKPVLLACKQSEQQLQKNQKKDEHFANSDLKDNQLTSKSPASSSSSKLLSAQRPPLASSSIQSSLIITPSIAKMTISSLPTENGLNNQRTLLIIY